MQRKRHQEFEMPDWIKVEVMKEQEQRVLIPVQVRREEVKKTEYRYHEISEDEPTWYDSLVIQLANYLSDMIYLQGSRADIDQIICNWLDSHRELYRAAMIQLLSEDDLRETLLNNNINISVTNSVVRLVFS